MKIPTLSIDREIESLKNNTPVFQRIDIEYIVALKGYDKDAITTLLIASLQNSMRQSDKPYTWERSLNSQVDKISNRLITQNHSLFQQDLPNRKESLILSVITADKSKQAAMAQSVTKKLHKAILSNKDNDHLHFDLAWLYLFYHKQYTQAEKYFKIVIKQANDKNSAFALFTSRHLAKAHYLNSDFHAAEAVMTEVLNSTLHPDPEYQYEYARYLAAMGELKLSSLYLEQAIEKLPIYYMQATIESAFRAKGIISQLLNTYKEQSLKYLREQYTQTWKDSNLAQLDLPEGLSTRQAFKKSCKKHEEEIQKHVLVIVKNNREDVKQQLLKYSKETLLTELIDKEAAYMKAIGHKRNQWKWINKSGGALIHAASILLLGTLFVLAAKIILVSIGLGTFFYFEEVTGRAFLAVLALGLIGTYLLKSQPFGIKKLFRKSLVFRDAMISVHKLL